MGVWGVKYFLHHRQPPPTPTRANATDVIKYYSHDLGDSVRRCPRSARHQTAVLACRTVQFHRRCVQPHLILVGCVSCARRRRSSKMKQQLDVLSDNRCFGGQQKVYEHDRLVATLQSHINCAIILCYRFERFLNSRRNMDFLMLQVQIIFLWLKNRYIILYLYFLNFIFDCILCFSVFCQLNICHLITRQTPTRFKLNLSASKKLNPEFLLLHTIAPAAAACSCTQVHYYNRYVVRRISFCFWHVIFVSLTFPIIIDRTDDE